MKRLYKLLGILLSLMLAAGLCACGGNKAETKAPTEPQESIRLVTGTKEASATKAAEEKSTEEAKAETAPAESTLTGGETYPSVIGIGSKPGEKKTEEETSAPSGEKPEAGFTEADLSLSLDGVSVNIGDDFEEISGLIYGGDPTVAQGQACIGGGFDTNYYYSDEAVCVYTLGDDGKQAVYDIYVTLEGFSTRRGAVIGSTTRAELAELYGAPTSTMAATDRYMLDGSSVQLSFGFENDVLTSIDLLDTEAG